jgi:hypothetical protein
MGKLGIVCEAQEVIMNFLNESLKYSQYKAFFRFKILSLSLFFALFFLVPSLVNATIYSPGQTLEPDCAPGSANCGVSSNGWTALSDISLTKGYSIVGNDAGVAQATSSLFISSTGNVGIGNTNPTSKLSVNGTIVGNYLSATLGILANTSIQTDYQNYGSGYQYGFGTDGSGTGYIINKFGVGSTSPNWKLSVAGIGSFDDYVRASYFTATSTTASSTLPNLLSTNFRLSGKLYDGSNSAGTNGMVLQTTGTGLQWVATSSLGITGSGASALSALTDTTIGSPTNGQVLQFNGTKWVNVATSSLGITGGVGGGWDALSDISLTKGYTIVGDDSGLAQATSSLFISSTGNVGVGTVSPRVSLEVNGTIYSTNGSDFLSLGGIGTITESGNPLKLYRIGTTPRLQLSLDDIWVTDSSDNPLVTFKETGNVGIGTTTPIAKLHIGYTSPVNPNATTQLAIGASSPNNESSLLITETSDTPMSLSFGVNDTGAFSEIQSLERGMSYNRALVFQRQGGKVGIGTTSPYAKLSVVGETVSEYFTATSTTATSTFTGGLTAGGATGLYVLQNGNVGIGTGVPGTNLHIRGSYTDSLNPTLRVTSVLPGIAFDDISGHANSRNWSILNGYNEEGLLQFLRTGSTGGNPSSVTMTLDRSGNVGIGTTTPEATLDIYDSEAFTVGQIINTGDGTSLSVENKNASPNGFSVFDVIGTESGAYNLLTVSNNGVNESGNVLTVTGTGNIGIGTTSPTARLSIKSSSLTNTGGIRLVKSSTDAGYYDSYINSTGLLVTGYAGTDVMSLDGSNIRLGLGTTSPYAKLSVVGETVSLNFTATSTTASSTLPNLLSTNFRLSGKLYDGSNSAGTNGMVLQTTGTGLQWVATSSLGITGSGASALSALTDTTIGSPTNGQVLQFNGTKWVNVATSSLGITSGSGSGTVGSGTTGQVPYYASNGTTLSATSSLFISTAGNFGIGTTTPSTQLTVYNGSNTGTSADNNAITIKSLNRTGYLAIDSAAIGSPSVVFYNAGTEKSRMMYSNATDAFTISTAATERIRIDSAGNFGIGTTSPYAKLSVVGETVSEYFTATSTTASSTLPNLLSTNLRLSGKLYDRNNSAGTNGMVIQTTGTGLQWVATSSLGIRTTQWTDQGSDISYETGRVGIGNSSPLAALHVSPPPDGYFNGFESGTVSPFVSGGRGWSITNEDYYAGVYSAKAAELPDGFYSDWHSTLTLVQDITSGSRLIYYMKRDVETGGGGWMFFDNGVLKTVPVTVLANGWKLYEYDIPTGGTHTFVWETYMISSGAKKMYLDNVQIVPAGGSLLTTAIFDNAVGINTSNPTAMLDVVGTIKGTAFVGNGSGLTNLPITSQWTSASSNIYFNTGNVGIGTTSPESKLHISVADTLSTREKILNLSMSGLSDSTTVAGFYNGTINDGVFAPAIYSFRNDNINRFVLGNTAFIGSTADVAGYEPLLFFQGSITNSSSDPLNGTLSPLSNRNIWGVGNRGSVKVVVGPTGNLGIGTTTPSGAGTVLHLYNEQNTGTVDSNATMVIESLNRNANYTARIPIFGASTFIVQDQAGLISYGQFGVIANGGSSPYAYIGTNGLERLRIDSTGNLGLGTTSPYAKLSVVGETVSLNFTATSTTASSTLPNLFSTNFRLSGKLYDGSNSAGTNGMVLQTTGTELQWVATSSLGITGSGASALSALTDTTIGSPTNGQVLQFNGTKWVNVATSSLGITGGGWDALSDISLTKGYTIIGDDSGLAQATSSLFISSTGSVGIGTNTPAYPLHVYSDSDEDTNYITIAGQEDKTKGFVIETNGNYKWSNYIYDGEDGDTQYFASGNSGRDVLTMQSGGRVGINIPTLLANIGVLRIVQTGSNTYATLTTETPHRISNGTTIRIEGATTEKFNGSFVVSSVSTMTFRISGLEVGAVSEEPTDAEVVMDTTIPAAFSIMPQYFDSVYTFDKSLDTGAGTGYTNVTADMRTSFGTSTVLKTTSGSYLYIGKQYPWRATSVNIATASNGASGIVVEYSTATGWTALTTSVTSGNSLVDNTSRLRNDGNISWDLRSFKNLWKPQILQVNPAPQYTQNLYWIRVSLTGTITTAPVAYAIGNHGVDRLAVFGQSGDLNPFFKLDQMGRMGLLPAELETDYKLGTLSGLTTSKFEVVAEDGARSDFVYYLANNDAAAHPAILMARSGGTVAAKTPVTNGMDLGGIYGEAYDGTTFREASKILMESASDATTSKVSSVVSFFTRPTQTDGIQQRMRIDSNGRVGIGQNPASGMLDLAGTLAFRELPTPPRPVPATPTSGGSITVGTHSWKVTYTSAAGETIPSTASSVVTIASGNQTVVLDITLGPPTTTSRKIYRTVAGNTGNWKLAGTVTNNTSTTYTDTADDSSLGADAPSANTSLVGNINVGSTNVLTLTTGGNLGIGTTSPFAKLSVAGIGSFDDYVRASYFTATSTTASSTLPNLLSTNLRLSGRLFDGNNSAGTNGMVLQSTGTGLQWVATSSLGITGGSGWDALSDISLTNGYSIVGNDAGVAQATSSLFISSTGNVGIGTTTNLNYRLHITNTGTDVSSLPLIKLQYTDEGSTVSEAGFVVNEGSTYMGGVEIFGSNAYTSSGWNNAFIMTSAKNDLGKLIFRTKTGGAYQNRMVIDNLGNVGIGTTTLLTNVGASLHLYNERNTGTLDSNATMVIQSVNRNANYTARIPTSGGSAFIAQDQAGLISYGQFGVNANGGSLPYAYINTNGSERLRIDSTGNLGLGTTSPSSRLAITQSANTAAGGLWLAESSNTDFRSAYMSTAGVLSFYGGDTAGTLNTATLNAAGAWTNASDASYKENVVDLNTVYNLGTVLSLQPRYYKMKGMEMKQIGFVAQELEKFVPEVVDGENGSKGVSYGNLTALTISAIQDISKILEIKQNPGGIFVSGKLDSILVKLDKLLTDFNSLLEKVTGFEKEIKTEKICVGNTCVTEEQLKNLIEKTSISIPSPSTLPTPTPTPDATPLSTPTVTPTPESSSTPAPSVTPEPTPEATPTVTPTPESSSTPAPSVTPEPTPEAIPVSTPTPEATPTVTPTPESSSTPAPSVTPEPTPEAIPEPAPTTEALPEPEQTSLSEPDPLP